MSATVSEDAFQKRVAPFQSYQRRQIAELREWVPGDDLTNVSISGPDRDNGSPKAGDMIARNPKNHEDQWLVSAAYFADNFAPFVPSPFEPGEYIEVRVRRFFSADEADAVPAVTIAGPADQDWSAAIARIGAAFAEVLAGAPLTNVRTMTRDELKTFLDEEAPGH